MPLWMTPKMVKMASMVVVELLVAEDTMARKSSAKPLEGSAHTCEGVHALSTKATTPPATEQRRLAVRTTYISASTPVSRPTK